MSYCMSKLLVIFTFTLALSITFSENLPVFLSIERKNSFPSNPKNNNENGNNKNYDKEKPQKKEKNPTIPNSQKGPEVNWKPPKEDNDKQSDSIDSLLLAILCIIMFLLGMVFVSLIYVIVICYKREHFRRAHFFSHFKHFGPWMRNKGLNSTVKEINIEFINMSNKNIKKYHNETIPGDINIAPLDRSVVPCADGKLYKKLNLSSSLISSDSSEEPYNISEDHIHNFSLLSNK